ncbi:hypothetical protein LTR70_007666 [Exophiala xenobiotica]|uniref:Uncharacterized protein n=1 Tax=Lithohypha guttulata TaxID=1690604 RepID=A0ABR0K1L5_9EURO|nr:hypothetical protein LTR24_007935 [Lithohypha guttulata]KAK5313362.1 hypothetical protein LTR70_007666 [Exophiala xenobiotica]
MPGKEDKLYTLGGVSRPKLTYHWAFLVAPKNENNDSTGTRYHAKNAPGQSTWIFEEKSTSMTATNMILVRVMIGKINDPQALTAKLRQVPVVNENPDWNCVIRAATMQYCEQKTAQGRFRGEGNFDTSKVPTFDLLQGKEITK